MSEQHAPDPGTDQQEALVVGNLTTDPTLRYTPNGTPVANFRLAVTPRIRDEHGWHDGPTSFVPVVVWRDQAANAAESLRKGDRAIVSGRWKPNSWTDQDGNTRITNELHADEVGASLKFAACRDLSRARQAATGGRSL